MLPSYLLSALHSRFGAADLGAFSAAHDDAWLVWEPGPWQPAGKGKTQGAVPMAGVAPAPAPMAEALAIQLRVDVHFPEITLGRDEQAAIAINDGTLSRIHLVFHREFSGWEVEDIGSSNGSWLGMKKLSPRVRYGLQEGAQLQAGRVFLSFHFPAGMLARVHAAGP